MEVIVINRKLSTDEENEILQLLKKDKTIELFNNSSIPGSLQKYSNGITELTPEKKREINFSIFNKIIEFGEIILYNKAIADLLTFEKVSIWHYHKFRIYFAIRNLYYEIELINQLRHKYTGIHYFGENKLLYGFQFDNTRIRIKTPTVTKSGFSIKNFIRYVAFFKIRALLGFFQLPRLKNKKYIVIDHAIKQTCLNLNTLQPEPGNYNLQYLFDKLDDEFIILDDVDIPKFNTDVTFPFDTSRFKSVKNRFFGEWVLFQGLMSGKVRKDLKKVSSHLQSQYNQIDSKLNDPINKIVLKQLQSLHASSKLFLFKYLAYKKFLTKYHFTSISSIDENSARIKSILDAAKSKNIATIGIQHGTIHELHPAYIYSKKDQQRKIVSDFTMVWGKYWSEFLIRNGNYNTESLFVTGQIRTDIIPNLESVKAHDYLNIPKDNRLIVFASQPQRDPTLREQAAFDVFTAVKDQQNVQLIVKLHPAEKNDFDYYHSIAEAAGCNNYQILLQFDLYLLISLSDIMITCFSTVGAETVYFNKPLIILDHLKQDIQGYAREGIALQTSNSKELKNNIEKILTDEISINKTAYQNYIEKYAYKIDGKVADRIIEFLKNLN